MIDGTLHHRTQLVLRTARSFASLRMTGTLDTQGNYCCGCVHNFRFSPQFATLKHRFLVFFTLHPGMFVLCLSPKTKVSCISLSFLVSDTYDIRTAEHNAFSPETMISCRRLLLPSLRRVRGVSCGNDHALTRLNDRRSGGKSPQLLASATHLRWISSPWRRR